MRAGTLPSFCNVDKPSSNLSITRKEPEAYQKAFYGPAELLKHLPDLFTTKCLFYLFTRLNRRVPCADLPSCL